MVVEHVARRKINKLIEKITPEETELWKPGRIYCNVCEWNINVRAGLIWRRIGDSGSTLWNSNEISYLTKDGNLFSIARLQTSQRGLCSSKKFVRPHPSPE